MLHHRLTLFVLLALPVGGSGQVITPYDPGWSPIGVFSPASRCDNCHAATAAGTSPAVMRAPDSLDPATPSPNGRDLSPIAGERVNLMGHAMDDPYFHATVEDEVDHFESLAGAIEDTCLTCHAPMAHAHAHSSGTGLDGDGFYRMQQALSDMHARAAVSCTLCHQIEPDPTADPGNGNYQVRDDMTLLGPYPDPDRITMAGYDVEQNDTALRIRDSELCGSCHNLRTPVVDVDTGLPTGGQFLEQGTWYEWRNSSFGGPIGDPGRTNCHSCHMPQPTPSYATKVSTSGNPPARTSFGSHDLAGGNTHTLSMLSQNRVELGLDATLTSAEFDQAIAVTRELLATAATLDLLGTTEADTINVDATVTNLTGHKLPSGFPSRRMWIHLEVRDSLDQLVFDSGRPDAQGRLVLDSAFNQPDCLAVAKPAGFDNTACFEPHRDVISDPGDVALYESVLADTRGNITHVLLYAASYLKDNRLPPTGYSTASPVFVADTAPVGVSGDADFHLADSGTDTVSYSVDTSGQVGPFQITARLLYQSIRPSFVNGLLTSGARVTDFKSMYSAQPPPAEQLAISQITLVGADFVFGDSFE